MFHLVQRLCVLSRQPKRAEQRRTLNVCADGQLPPKNEGESVKLCEEGRSGHKRSAALSWLVDECQTRTLSLGHTERQEFIRIGTSVNNFRPGEFLAATPAVMTLSTCVMLLGAFEGVLRPEEELDQEDAMHQRIRVEALAAALERGFRGLGVEDATRCRLAQAEKLLQTLRRVRASFNGGGEVDTGVYSSAVAARRLLLLLRRIEDVVQAGVEQLQILRLAKKQTKRLLGRRFVIKCASARAQQILSSGDRREDARQMQLLAGGDAGEGLTVLVYVYTTGIVITNVPSGCLPVKGSKVVAAVRAGSLWQVGSGTGADAAIITIEHNKGDIILRACSHQAAQQWVEAATQTMGVSCHGGDPTISTGCRPRAESRLPSLAMTSLGGVKRWTTPAYTRHAPAVRHAPASQGSCGWKVRCRPLQPSAWGGSRAGPHLVRRLPASPGVRARRHQQQPPRCSRHRHQTRHLHAPLLTSDTEQPELHASPLHPETATTGANAGAESSIDAAPVPPANTGASDVQEPRRALLMAAVRGGIKLRPVSTDGEGGAECGSECGGEGKSSAKTSAASAVTGAGDAQEPRRSLLMEAVRGGIKLRPVRRDEGDGESSDGCGAGAHSSTNTSAVSKAPFSAASLAAAKSRLKSTEGSAARAYTRRNTGKGMEESMLQADGPTPSGDLQVQKLVEQRALLRTVSASMEAAERKPSPAGPRAMAMDLQAAIKLGRANLKTSSHTQPAAEARLEPAREAAVAATQLQPPQPTATEVNAPEVVPVVPAVVAAVPASPLEGLQRQMAAINAAWQRQQAEKDVDAAVSDSEWD